MIFWVVLILFILSAIIYIPCKIYFDKIDTLQNNLKWSSDIAEWDKTNPKKAKAYKILKGGVGIAITSIFWIMLIACISFSSTLGLMNIDASSQQKALIEEAKVLQYQANNEFYTNVIDNGKSELYDKILTFNKDIAYYKDFQHNFWFGIYVPDIYDEVPLVVLLERG